MNEIRPTIPLQYSWTYFLVKTIILRKKRKFINEATHNSRNQKVKIVRAQKKRPFKYTSIGHNPTSSSFRKNTTL
jgi:hypothetical protein